MNFKILLFLSAISLIITIQISQEILSSNWAFLVSGSKGYANYRHNADVCHAYKNLIQNGFPAEKIILMAYNDIAYNSNNPFKGKLFNKPDPKGKGEDVFEGCKVDYSTDSVIPSVFLGVLSGNSSLVLGNGTQRIIESNSNDKIFLYYIDHGAIPFLSFPPWGLAGMLWADQLNDTITEMRENKKFSEMVIYIDACNSGSMFDGVLADDISVYAVSSANPNQNAWAIYCGDKAVVDGVNLGTCLGDEFSVAWLENIQNGASMDLQSDYLFAVQNVKKSDPTQYGQVSIANNSAEPYFGNGLNTENYGILGKSFVEDESDKDLFWDSRDVKLNYLTQKYLKQKSLKNKAKLMNEVKKRSKIDNFFQSFVEYFEVQKSKLKKNIPEIRKLVSIFIDKCPKLWDHYTFKYTSVFHDFVSLGLEDSIFIDYLVSICKNK